MSRRLSSEKTSARDSGSNCERFEARRSTFDRTMKPCRPSSEKSCRSFIRFSSCDCDIVLTAGETGHEIPLRANSETAAEGLCGRRAWPCPRVQMPWQRAGMGPSGGMIRGGADDWGGAWDLLANCMRSVRESILQQGSLPGVSPTPQGPLPRGRSSPPDGLCGHEIRDRIGYVNQNPLKEGLAPRAWPFVPSYNGWPLHHRAT